MHARIGATHWETLSRAALADLGGAALSRGTASLRRTPSGWTITSSAQSVAVPVSKGWADIAALLAHPGEDFHVLQLIDSGLIQQPAGDLADRNAIGAYRARLRQLDENLTDAEHDNDLARAERMRLERDALLTELARVTGRTGAPRPDAGGVTERARKAVSARIRDAIRKVTRQLPELADQLDRHIVTGNWCRYRPDEELIWTVEA